MKTVKTIVLVLALGLAGYTYASGNTDSEARGCKVSSAAAACCVTDTKCCKADESCCKSCSDTDCCKKDSGCCGKESKCCTEGTGCCKAGANSEKGCCGPSCGKPKNV